MQVNNEAHDLQAIPVQYSSLPFVCGEIGFTSYDWGKKRLTAHPSIKTEPEFPEAFAAYYTWSYVFNHEDSTGYLTFSPLCRTQLVQSIISIIDNASVVDGEIPLYSMRKNTLENSDSISWRASQNRVNYQEQFNKVKDYILAGDCYQVNLAQRFEAQLEGDVFKFYSDTRSKTNTHFACYFSFGRNQTLLSFSPEQFISIKDRRVTTRPIKGTIENKQDLSPQALLESEKNRAENLMIVDLLRNDLSKVCKTHSVKTEELFKLETYKNVHHLVSTITGELEDGISEKDAYLSCFPGGSITGAPKKRAIEIIDELELYNRSAYCGSVYYLNDNGNFDSNILIRSIVHSGDKLYCWGGGGIVADSNAEEEYQESIAKVRNLFDELDLS